MFLTSKVPWAEASFPTVTAGLSPTLVVLDEYECVSQCPSLCTLSDIFVVARKKKLSLRIMKLRNMTLHLFFSFFPIFFAV